MYKVVLIDDEAVITEGLRKVVDWSAHNCRVAALAQDAASGAEAIRTHRPDILFTDIKMPGEDGLTMLAGLKGEFPRMQIAVLTGYRDFEYAQRAIRLGVSRFLLKPSKMEELNEALEHMTGVLDRLPPSAESEPPEEGEDPNSFLVRRAQSYITEHCAQRLSLQEVADHCYVSQWHLSKLLNKHLKQSFYDLLNAERVCQAKRLMADPSLRISEVAERVGYVDTAHFSRVFKKLEGVSAGEWRNLHGGKDSPAR
jgi:two-component system response regulator YesN